MSLREKIEQEIEQRGAVPFSRYMELCLYDPEFGYYSRDAEQFGKAGDFYTSSDVHAVFGRLLSRQFQEMWEALGRPERVDVLELGPGRGLFARDVLDWSRRKFPEFFAALHYRLLETSPALQAKLRSTLVDHFAAGKCSLVSLDSAIDHGVPTIIFANEFFDALPCEVLSEEGKLYIAMENGRLVESWKPASAEELAYLDRYSVHPRDGQRVEVGLAAQSIMRRLAGDLREGFAVVIDYGYTRAEQLADRHLDTILAYRAHSVSRNPYEAPGEQDITVHVNFTALAAAAEPGMQVFPLVTQSQFLMGIGEANQFADAFEECRVPQEHAKVALQLKHLVTPAGMGETFHVMVGSKGLNSMPPLGGLRFARSLND
ncbi:MAG: SAM-dependent methyltransferase [Acidobacteriales bacterium]|nr:SAM-dependent methyltransferase [Terriglobales bacterium]